ncbi:phage baseplate assembly protein V, partial [Chryseobacterium indoltheticum]|uniref:phage baseplate assembly protein V n=1 Tax=Chryseobacterium indoltheticum TaxID=254 RepID=UPI003F49A5BA
ASFGIGKNRCLTQVERSRIRSFRIYRETLSRFSCRFTDQITQNRGYVAIPEVGDQVMVNFVHNHPDRPFVMGECFMGELD